MPGMKATTCLSLFLAFVLCLSAACRENPVEEYGTDLVDSYEHSRKAGDAASLEGAKRSITVYRATEGRYPAGLEEISASMGTELDPAVYDYDPSTGRISLR
jgi:hypothetical protein